MPLRVLSPRALTSTPIPSKIGPIAYIGAITDLRARYALTRNTSAHPHIVVRSTTIGTVDETIKSLGVVLYIRLLMITITEPMITRPMAGPEQMNDPGGWTHNQMCFVGNPLPMHLTVAVLAVSM